VRIVTHAHADHTIGLQQSLRTCRKVLMTEATRDLVTVMMGPFFAGARVLSPDYGETVHLDEGETLTFYPADHILGATQILIEDAEGTRIAYTGDFKIENTPVLEADVLVMEATYGNPDCRRPFKEEIDKTLVSLVERGLRQGTVYIFGYHGKLQEVMQILRQSNVRGPFVAPERVYSVSKVCEKHGMQIGQLLLSDELRGKELLESNGSCVAFYHMNSTAKVGLDAFRIVVSGWEFSHPQRQTGPKEYTIALSDHSDYNELIQYIRQSKPKQVITDSYRDGHAEALARQIRMQFAIPATALPRS